MKRFLTAAVVAVSIAFAGCAQLGQIASIATTTITTPVSATNLYQGKLVFAASQELVLKYQQDCFGSQLPPYPVSLAVIRADAVLSIQCKRRVSRYNAMKSAENRANAAIIAADNFIARNPTGNAASYIAAALRAVNDYRATVGG